MDIVCRWFSGPEYTSASNLAKEERNMQQQQQQQPPRRRSQILHVQPQPAVIWHFTLKTQHTEQLALSGARWHEAMRRSLPRLSTPRQRLFATKTLDVAPLPKTCLPHSTGVVLLVVVDSQKINCGNIRFAAKEAECGQPDVTLCQHVCQHYIP